MFTSTFGQQSQNKPAFSFDSSTNANFIPQQQSQPSGFGFGSSLNQPQQQQLGASQGPQQVISRTTRVSDLSQNVQCQFEELNKYIQSQIQTCEEITARAPVVSEIVSSVFQDVQEVERKLSAVTAAINTDMSSISRIKETVDTDIENVRLSTRVVDAIKVPGTVLPRSSSDPIVRYFHNTADYFSNKMHVYAGSLGEIEKHLDALEMKGGVATTSQVLFRTLQNVNAVFMGFANKVAELHDQVKKLQVTEGISHK